ARLTDSGKTLGYFTGLTFSRLGVKVLGSSFPGWTTPYIGFNLMPGASRAEMLAPLTEWAFRELRCLHVEVSDCGFLPGDGDAAHLSRTAYETYQSDLTRSEDDLFKGMESACRRCVRKAEKSGVVIEHADDPAFADEYYEQLKDVFAKQG